MASFTTRRRIFIYGLQSSGASLFAYFLAQQPDTVAVLDLLAPHIAPDLQVKTAVIVKATISPAVDLAAHLESFQPDCTLLYLRHPLHNYRSLTRKSYRDDGGPIDAKFIRLEQVFRRRDRWFNAAICYESFAAAPTEMVDRVRRLGIRIPPDAAQFKRPLSDIVAQNQEWSWWCRQYFGEKWHLGNIHADNLKSLHPIRYTENGADDVEKVRRLCPLLTAYYEGKLERQSL